MNVQPHSNTNYNCKHICTFDLCVYYNKQHYLLTDYNKQYQLQQTQSTNEQMEVVTMEHNVP